MSFRCQKCHQHRPGAPRRVVTKTEPITHPARCDSRGHVIDRGGEGTRIVEERNVCGECDVVHYPAVAS